MIKVSIVVAIYNTEKYLSRCLDSIDRQTIDSYEVLLINDGSTDSSEEICKAFICNKKRYHLISKTNGGLSSARKCGWQAAKGEYIVFIDSDDYIDPLYCEMLYDACVEHRCDLSMCGYTAEGTVSKKEYCLFNHENIISNLKEDYIKPLIAHMPSDKYSIPAFLWLRMMKRELITETCFIHEDKVFSEDLLFNLVYASKVGSMAVVNKSLYNYCINDGSLTRKYRLHLWDMYKTLYNYCKWYCSIEKITGYESRVTSLIFKGILHCAQQASYLDYKDFYKDMNPIRKDILTKEMITSVRFLSKTYSSFMMNYKLIYFMIRFMPTIVIYYFYKWRHSI